MKTTLTFFILLLSVFSFSQECDYKLKIDTDEENFKLTDKTLVEFLINNDQTVFIYFSLMKEESIKSVVVHLSLNSLKMPPNFCYNEKSRISFKLENGEYVSAPYLGQEDCGRQSQNEGTLNNSLSEAAFYMDETTIKRLANSPITTMRITTMNSNFDVNFKEMLKNEQLETPIYPRKYFIENLKCIL